MLNHLRKKKKKNDLLAFDEYACMGKLRNALSHFDRNVLLRKNVTNRDAAMFLERTHFSNLAKKKKKNYKVSKSRNPKPVQRLVSSKHAKFLGQTVCRKQRNKTQAARMTYFNSKLSVCSVKRCQQTRTHPTGRERASRRTSDRS